ncbi:MAG: hypothetical protein M3Y79_05675 [Pseudomonadota bacterium]|nr:hypothetical protein [Pseudomonadota bacterium]
MIARLATALGSLSCGLMLSAPTYSVESPAGGASRPVEELVELEEVRVRGKVVANAVITVENRLFRRYNQLNKDNRFDVHCRDARARDSLALLRICTPEFISIYAAPAFLPASYGGRSLGVFPQCGVMSARYDYSGNVFYSSSCSSVGFGSANSMLYSTPYYAGTAGIPTGAAPQVTASPERIAEFKQNMTRVINSDPELHAMATQLIGMYEEVERVQARFEQLQEEKRAAQRARRTAARARGVNLWPPHPRAP